MNILILLTFLSIGFVIIAPFIMFDIWCKLGDKMKRKQHGYFTNVEAWKDSIERITQKWILNPPKVYYNANNRLRLWDILFHSNWSVNPSLWQKAGLLYGLIEAKSEHNNKLIYNHIREHINLETGKWYKVPGEIEGVILAHTYLCQNVVSYVDIRPAMDQIRDLIKEVEAGQETVPYRRELPNIRYIDTLGFICPFLYSYGTIYSDEESIKLAERQIEEYDYALMNGVFPAHAYNLKNGLLEGVHDWGRGLGWYILALTECYAVMKDNNLPDNLGLRDRILKISKNMLPFQTERGGIRSLFFEELTPADSSATVLCGLLFEKSYEISNDKIYIEAAQRTIAHLMYTSTKSGKIDMCQGDTITIGLYSRIYGFMPFAQGLALKLATKVKRYTL